MEPLNDEQLKEILREWRAPEVPAGLWPRLESRCRPRWWRWLLTGSVRIPVPALLLALTALAVILFAMRKPHPPPANPAGLADFQPVKQLNLRVIRSTYEPH
jgi:hypothetical protein